MSADILESDWKVFRELRELALQRFCDETCDEIREMASSKHGNAHERYLKLYRFIRSVDEEIGDAFNDFRRSTATMQILKINALDLWTDDEIARFSPRIQGLIDQFSDD